MKKIRIIIMMLIFSLFLSGSIFSKVQLRVSEPIIDLNDRLFGEDIGNPGSTDRGDSASKEYEDKEQKESDSAKASLDNNNDNDSRIIITVKNKNITCSGRTWVYNRETKNAAGFDTFVNTLESEKKITILDVFAEYHALMYVAETIREISPGLKIDSPSLVK